MKKVINRCMGALSLVLALTCAMPVSAATVYDIDRNVTYKTNKDGSLSIDKDNGTTYRNKITGETYVVDGRGKKVSGDKEKATTYEYYKDFAPQIYVNLDNDYSYDVYLRPGETLAGFALTSGKKSAIITKCGEAVSDGYASYDSETKQYYLERRDGSKDYVGSYENAKALKLKKYTYRYRIFGKKVGKANLEIKIADRTGAITTYNVKVIVSNDTRALKSVTYAGKELVIDMSKSGKNKKMLEAQTRNKNGIEYTTKKSGKFKVKMGKEYQFVTAYVIKPNPYVTKNNTEESGSYIKNSSWIKRGYSRGIDLNGDGDFDDEIDGIRENSYDGYYCQKIKNNQRISLNKSANESRRLTTWTSKTTNKVEDKSSSYYKSNMAVTHIIVVYQSKISKRFFNDQFTITLRVGKK
ncbi:MAG: hypothetical protein K6G06_03330 [Butyrivibrio sp.]|nr:hypothetical protein [Butyrivibrio sp.]